MDEIITQHLKKQDISYEISTTANHATPCTNILLKDHHGAYYYITTFPNKNISIEALKIFIGVPVLEHTTAEELKLTLNLSLEASSLLGFLHDHPNLTTALIDQDLLYEDYVSLKANHEHEEIILTGAEFQRLIQSLPQQTIIVPLEEL